MKTSTPKKVSRREKVVDSMAKKFADSGSVTDIITSYRKRKIKPVFYVYAFIILSVISTSITVLVMSGTIAPELTGKGSVTAAPPVRNSIDLLREDLVRKKIGPDEYVLYLKDYLIRYDSLPAVYKTERSTTTSREIYRSIFDIWPKVSLHTRANLLKSMPYLETKWKALHFERPQ